MEAPLFLSSSQLECISSPQRAEIVRALAMDGKASAADLAHHLGRRVTRLYHHLAALMEAGIIHVVEHRRGLRRPEAIYALVSNRLSSAAAVESAEGRAALAKTARRYLAAAARRFDRAMKNNDGLGGASERTVALRQIQTRLNPTALAQLNQDMDALLNRYADVSDSEGHSITVTLAITPER